MEKLRTYSFLWLPIVILAVVIALLFSSRRTKTSVDNGQVNNAQQTIIVSYSLNRWSKWIKIPPGKSFLVQAPRAKSLEALFWDGKKMDFKVGDVKWVGGEIENCRFRLKGTPVGEAKIIIN